MAGDLEDFLRRAAQRRAEAAATRPKQAQPQSPRRPEYTDRNRERSTSTDDADEEVVVADLVPPVVQPRRQTPQPPSPGPIQRGSVPIQRGAGPIQRVPEQIQRATQQIQIAAQQTQRDVQRAQHAVGEAQRSALEAQRLNDIPEFAADPTVQALLRLMTNPSGIRQAILAREILDPPHHRW